MCRTWSNMDEPNYRGRGEFVEHRRTWSNMDEDGRTGVNMDEHELTNDVTYEYLTSMGRTWTNMDEHGRTISEGGGGDI